MAVELPTRAVDLDGLVIGNPPVGDYALTDLHTGGKPETAVGDKPRPREDGVFFGRDLLATGRVITLEGAVSTDDSATCLAAWETLNSAWDADTTRLSPGAVLPLRLRIAGAPTRVVYGRPRELDPKEDPGFSLVDAGRIDFAAQFRAVNHLYYDDLEQTEVIGVVPATSSGLTSPLMVPLSMNTTVDEANAQGTVDVGGTQPATPVITIYGPITNPTWFAIGYGWLQLQMTLAADQFVTLDCRPWVRTVRLNGVTDCAGLLTSTSLRLSQARLFPGRHRVVLRGTSATGTAYMTTTWRDTYKSI